MSESAPDKVGENGYADSAEEKDMSPADFNWRKECYMISEEFEQMQHRLGALELSLPNQKGMLQYYAIWMDNIKCVLEELLEGGEVNGQSTPEIERSQRDELDSISDGFASIVSNEQIFLSGDVVVSEELYLEQRVEQQLTLNSQSDKEMT